MVFQVGCECGRRFLVEHQQVGKPVSCAGCGRVFNAPAEPTPPVVPRSFKRELPGGLLALGSVAGIFALLCLPVLSSTIRLGVAQDSGAGVPARAHWLGQCGVAAYLLLILLAAPLTDARVPPRRSLCWLALGVAVFAVLLAIFLLVVALDAPRALREAGVLWMEVSVGSGTILNLLAALAVTTGAILRLLRQGRG